MGITSPRVDDAFFEDVTSVITESVVSFEGDGSIVFTNRAAEALLGYGPDELLDRSIDDLIPDDHRRAFARLQRRATDGADVTTDLSLRHEDGRELPVTIAVKRVAHGEQHLYVANFHDRSATDDRAGSGEDSAYAARLEALNEASRRLVAAETTAEIGQITVDVVETVLERSLTAVWLVDDDEDVLRLAAASEAETSLSKGDEVVSLGPITAETTEMSIYESGETVVLEEYDAVEQPAHPAMGLDARLVASLGDHGVVTVGSRGGDDLDASVRELIDILAKNTRAALDRLEREQLLRQRSGAIDAANDGMAITDEDDVFTYMNDVHAELLGYDDADAFVGTTWKHLFAASEVERFDAEVLPVLAERGSWRGEVLGTHATTGDVPLEITLSTLDDGGLVCIVRDITEQKAQERQLESLNDVARELMAADDVAEITRVGIEAVEDVLGFESACLRLFDDGTKRLECAALTDAAEQLLDTHAAYDLEATLAGHAFREAQPVVNRQPVESSSGRSAIGYPSFHVPLGSYGVLSVVLRPEDAVDERELQLAEMLSVTIRTAIARAERVRLLRTHERELRQQRDQLATHNRINQLIQQIGQRLLEATTRGELEGTICDQLVQSDLYHSAWIGDVEASTDRVTTRTGSGITERDLEAINEMSISSIGNGSVERTIETGDVEVVRYYQLEGREAADESATDVLSTAAVPLTYGDQLLGILVVTGSGDGVFGEETLIGFESLGKVTGFAINAIRNRTLLLSDSVIELEFEIEDPDDFYVHVSSTVGCDCRLERSVPIEAGRILNYHTITGTDPAPVLKVAAADDQIEDARVTSEDDDQFVLQTVTTSSTVHVALEGGATLRSARIADGTARIVLDVPQTANVRETVSLLEEAFASVELVAKRDRDRSIQTVDEFRQTIDSELTEKQRSTIESAYAAGYYDWPRSITAEDLADSRGVSSSTLHQHLRKGIQSLLTAFFEERTENEG